ncbi:MAG: hypothetical protein ACPHY8_01370 [Patescibacteria group bacterium]
MMYKIDPINNNTNHPVKIYLFNQTYLSTYSIVNSSAELNSTSSPSTH